MARPSGHSRDSRLRSRIGALRETALTEFLLRDSEQTSALGRRIGRAARGGLVIALRGPLGAGKTTLAKGIALGLGVVDEVTSPTYALIAEYPAGELKLYHMDAYRLTGSEDFASSGGAELLGDPDAVCVVEWAERVDGSMPRDAARIDIAVKDDGTRLVRLDSPDLERLLS